MPTRSRPVVLDPQLRPYAWGDRVFIPTLLQRPPTDAPCAEAWFGAHPSGPSSIVGTSHNLLEHIANDGIGFLGPRVHAQFSALPFLLKVLSAARPLSLQVHPNAARAAAGFAEENAAGLELGARERRYKDPHHKPELIVALTPFDALCGFRTPEAIATALAAAPELSDVLTLEDGLSAALRRYYALDDLRVHAALKRWLDRLSSNRDGLHPDDDALWVLRAHEVLGSETPDRGLPFMLLLHRLRLQPGQALFLPAGVPHAYLHGAAIEVMANSDNVLRAGLTAKHVDPAELLEVVRFDAGPPPVLEPLPRSEGVRSYAVPTAEFGLERVDLLEGERFEHIADGPELWLAVPQNPDPGDPAAAFRFEDEVTWSGGQCLALAHGTALRGTAQSAFTMYRAHVPNDGRATPTFRGRTPTTLRFGTSGLRGKVEDITDLEAYINTRGFLDVMLARGLAVPGTPVVLAGDLRPSTHSPTRSIMRAVAHAITDAGMQVDHQGRIPTPALTLHGLARGGPSVMVTGSHIPFDRNGIKFNTSHGELLKSDEPDVLAAVARARAREYERPAADSPFDDDGWFREGIAKDLPPPADDAANRYAARYRDVFASDALAGLKVVLYEHSAVGREHVARILEGLGASVLPRGRSTTFVPIDTEALGDDGLATLQRLADEAREQGHTIDAVISTDGDSDRPLVAAVDEQGAVHFVGGDVLGVLVARALKADAIAVPVSATDMIESVFGQTASVRRTRIGSPWVIAAMADMAGERRVGWEANGGFLHATALTLEHGTLAPLPTRDAVLPIVTVLAEAAAAKARGTTLIACVAELPPRHSRAGLLDEIDPARSRALLRRFGMPRPEIRGARRTAEGFEGFDTTGASIDLSDKDVSVLRRLFARLSTYLHARRGFTDVHAVDTLDGVRIAFDNGDVAHVRPSGNAPQLRIYAQANEAARADAIVAEALSETGALHDLLEAADRTLFETAVLRNVKHGRALFEQGQPAAVLGAVCGSQAARTFWQSELDAMRTDFGAQTAVALHEDLPVNQALGLLLLWERLRPHYQAGRGALVAFVFGSGTRAAPLTEAECGQKPAIDAFVRVGASRRRASLVELALRTFAPVEAFLRRSGFEGIVVKWGDEVQIPTHDLSGHDPSLAGADIVRFVSMQPITEDAAANKDWVGVDAHGRVTAFIPRRPLVDMEPLAERGLLQRRGDTLVGGVNLGSIAISAKLADVLLEEFATEIHDASAQRKDRPDLDPQLFTALTIAVLPTDERTQAWAAACAEAPAIAKLAQMMPDVLDRLAAALGRFEQQHGAPVKLAALDFGDQYWGDIGQHRRMYEFYTALREDTVEGTIARALAGLPPEPDQDGNWIAGETVLGEGVSIKDSVLIDVKIERGSIDRSVLLGTDVPEVHATQAFDVASTVKASMKLGPRAGGYKLVSNDPIEIDAGHRGTTVFLPEGPQPMSVHEDTDLRDKGATYDVPIEGNALSFAQAHARAIAADPAQLREARETARRKICEERS